MLLVAALIIRIAATVPLSHSPSCHINSSKLYIDALYAKTPQAAAAIPLEPNVVRFEGPPGLPVQTAFDAQSLRTSTYAGASAVFLTGTGPGDLVLKDLNEMTTLANYTIMAGAVIPLTTTRVVEYFTFESTVNCNIKRIDAEVF